jgi:hypothetical protein
MVSTQDVQSRIMSSLGEYNKMKRGKPRKKLKPLSAERLASRVGSYLNQTPRRP